MMLCERVDCANGETEIIRAVNETHTDTLHSLKPKSKERSSNIAYPKRYDP